VRKYSSTKGCRHICCWGSNNAPTPTAAAHEHRALTTWRQTASTHELLTATEFLSLKDMNAAMVYSHPSMQQPPTPLLPMLLLLLLLATFCC
jgi:hypothetical protein